MWFYYYGKQVHTLKWVAFKIILSKSNYIHNERERELHYRKQTSVHIFYYNYQEYIQVITYDHTRLFRAPQSYHSFRTITKHVHQAADPLPTATEGCTINTPTFRQSTKKTRTLYVHRRIEYYWMDHVSSYVVNINLIYDLVSHFGYLDAIYYVDCKEACSKLQSLWPF